MEKPIHGACMEKPIHGASPVEVKYGGRDVGAHRREA